MKLSETAEQVIALAEAIRNYWDTELPKRHRDYPFVHPGEDSGPPPPEEQQLRDLLESLPAEVIYQLALLAHLGQGEFAADELAEGYEVLKERFRKPEWIAQMLGKASLADDLRDGLDELTRNRIGVDNLTLMSARPAKKHP